jgi:hypothetical protein
MLDNNKIEKQFVTYEIALKLKELDFDEEVIALYDTEFVETKCKLNIFAFTVPNKGVFEEGFKKGWCIKAPLWSQVIGWLKLNHKILIAELWDGWEFAKEDEDFIACETLEQAILEVIEIINKTQTNGK